MDLQGRLTAALAAIGGDYKKLAGVPSYATTLANLYRPETNLYNAKASNTRRTDIALARAQKGWNGNLPKTYNEAWITDSIGGGCTGLGAGAGGTDRFDRANTVAHFNARALSAREGIPITRTGLMRIHDATRWDDRFSIDSATLSANTGSGSTVTLPNGGKITHTTYMDMDTIYVPYYDNFSGTNGITVAVNGATSGTLFARPTGTGSGTWKTVIMTLDQKVPAGASIVITGVASSTTMVVNFLDYGMAVGGIVTHNLCASGSGAVDWANIAGGGGFNLLRQIRDNGGYLGYEFDVVHISFGLFDATGTVAAFKTNMQVIHDYFPNSDIVIHGMPVPGQYSGSGGAAWLPFLDACFDLADLWDCPLVDVQGLLGGYTVELANGLTADSTAHLLQPAYEQWGQTTALLTEHGMQTPWVDQTDMHALRKLDVEGANAAWRLGGQAKIDYDDAVMFTQDWSALPALKTASAFQISGNRLYDDGTSSAAQQTVILPLPRNVAVGEKFHFSFTIHRAAISGGGYVYVGLDFLDYTDTTVPGTYYTLFGVASAGALSALLGSSVAGITAPSSQAGFGVAGEYIVTIDGDENTISYAWRSTTDNTKQYVWTHPVAALTTMGKTIGRIKLSLGDSRGLTGDSIGPLTGVIGSQQVARTRKIANIQVENAVHRDVAKVAVSSSDAWRYQLPAAYDPRKPAPLALYFHQGLSSVNTYDRPWTNSNEQPITKALGDAGYIVASMQDGFTVGSTTTDRWGNNVSMNNIADFYQYLRSHFALNGTTVLYGPSMGGLTGLNVLAQRVIPGIAAAYFVCSSISLSALHADVNYQPAIRAAYGIASDGSDYAAKTQGRDPALFTGKELRGTPLRLSIVNDDPGFVYQDAFLDRVGLVLPEASRKTTATGGHLAAAAFSATDIMAHFNKFVTV